MARKTKPAEKAPKAADLELPEVQRAISEDAADLYRVHEKEILDFLAKSTTKKLTLTFAVVLDDSQTELVVETGMRTSQAIIDKRTRKMDPNGALNLFSKDEMDATRGGRGRRGVDAELPQEEAA